MEIKNDRRPWGFFRQFTDNEASTIKILNVDADKKLSLQYHHERDEFWTVLSGNPLLTIGDKIENAKAGDEFFIPKETIHRIETPEGGAQLLEIAFGEFDENDIVRIEDDYGRVR
jgi:mannose-6-phosphate isomerase-like protein (cupin superfamily)